MNTELDKVMDWYEIALDSQKVMKKLIKKNPEIIPLQSVLAAKELSKTTKLLETSIIELNDLAIVSLVSIFEQPLIEYFKKLIQKQMNPNDEFTNNISHYIIQKAERGRFTEIIDLFKPLVDFKLVGMVKQVYEYRNWVAHGKDSITNPASVDPVSAYGRLSEFLKAL